MRYPIVENENTTRDMIDVFGGYNHNSRINDNEFYDIQNMTSDYHPMLAPRSKRGASALKFPEGHEAKTSGLLYKNDMYYAVGAGLTLMLYKNGEWVASKSTDCAESVKRQMVMMGAYIIVLPDKIYFNTADLNNDSGYIEYTYTSIDGENVVVRPCDTDGEVYEINGVSDKMPENYFDKYVWLDTSSTPATLKRYYATNSMWSSAATNYLRLTCRGIGKSIKEGDGIKVSGFVNEDTKALNNTTVVKKVIDDDNVVVSGMLDTVRSKNTMTARWNVESDKAETEVAVYCSADVSENVFVGQKINIDGKVYECISNTPVVKSVEYEMDLSDSTYWMTDKNETVTTIRDSIPYKIYTAKDDTSGWNPKLTGGQKIFVGDELVSVNGFGVESVDGKQLTYISIQEKITFKAGQIIAFAKGYVSDSLKNTTLKLKTDGQKFNVKKATGISVALESAWAQTQEISISRTMPKMDYIVESKNRLWGCRYGKNADGEFINEIYASKLGDFKNWHCYEGISTDSYTASLGTSGKFTGAISYLGYPLFFKEDYLHTVYGNYPAQYQVNDTACRGVEEGSEDSLAMINEVLYYKSKTGIMAYSGALPAEVSYALGNKVYKNAKGCAYRDKYYVEMFDVKDNKNELIVYDTKRNLWHKENAINAIQICAADNDVYYIDEGYSLKTLFGSGGELEKSVNWYAETGNIGLSMIDKKYISRVSIRLSVSLGANVRVFVQYDSNGEWIQKMAVVGTKLKTMTLPIRPQRCDHFKLRIEGQGDVKIYSISKTLEQGSDI